MPGGIDSLYLRLRPRQAVNRLLTHVLFQGRPLTAKHRWMNPLLLRLYGVLSRLPYQTPVRDPIFIVGTGRSGTTILGQILSIHPDVCFLNEPKLLWYSVDPRDDVLGNFSEAPGTFFMTEADYSHAKYCRIKRLYSIILKLTGTTNILDKYPEMIFRVRYIRSMFPNAKFLFLVRNGWDTVGSITTWSRTHEVTTQDGRTENWWGLNNRKWTLLLDQVVNNYPPLVHIDWQHVSDYDRAAVEWVMTMQEGLQLIDTDAEILLIRYEDLLNDPQKIICDIVDFCGLSYDQSTENYATEILMPQIKSPQVKSINPHLRPLFDQTMQQLGYTS